MPTLIPPTAVARVSFLAALVEYHQEGRYRDLRPGALAGGGFDTYLAALATQALPETPRPAGSVAQTTLWWVHGNQFLGRLSIRHQLTQQLCQLGGHIGYDVAPSVRRRGHATAMLRAALPVAAGIGIETALITCDRDNRASQKVIEANGGRLWQADQTTLRFWTPTRPAMATPTTSTSS